MMWRLALAVLGLAGMLAGPVAACDREMLRVTEWRIEPVDDDTNRLTVHLTYRGERPLRMMDASVSFADVLGARIGSFAVTRDRAVAPGDDFAEVGLWGPFTFERLLGMHPEDVVVATCLRAVVHADGTIARFD